MSSIYEFLEFLQWDSPPTPQITATLLKNNFLTNPESIFRIYFQKQPLRDVL